MKRAALIATVSLVALVAAGARDAGAATHGLWWRWGAQSGFSSDPWGRTSTPYQSAKDRSSKEKTSRHRRERSHESKSASDAPTKPLPKGPLHIIVSIDRQRATLFAGGEPVADSKISTGMPGHPTPMGVFTVIQKNRHHISNLYDAPMPYMLRITWSGSALHEGPLPGHPASHGCVRLSSEFAQLLWKNVKIGTRVIITRDEVKPEPIESARLDALSGAAPQARAAADPAPTSAVTVADAGAMAFASAKKRHARDRRRAAPAPVLSVPPAMPIVSETLTNTADQQATKFLTIDGAPATAVRFTAPRAPAADEPVTEPAAAAAPAPSATPIVPAPVAPTQPTKAAEESAPAETTVAAIPTTPAPKEPAPVAAGETSAAEPTADKPIATEPAVAAINPAPVATDEKPAATPVPEARRKPVSLFVSLKDGKLYARQGMEALFDMPISVAHPEQPLGTHVFTAMAAKDGGGLRWTVVTIPSDTRRTVERNVETHSRKKHDERAVKIIPQPETPPPSAAAALDRIVLPQAAMERIAGLVLPGSSLIVSDNKLSDETNASTEFIVLTR